MTLTAAQKEAYARANSNTIDVCALELRHPSFVEPLRFVGLQENLSVTLEANAPVNAGEVVEFIALALRLRLPDLNTEADSTLSVQIDGIPGIAQPYLKAANQTVYPIEATARFYAFNTKTSTVIDGAQSILHLQVRHVGVTKSSVSLTMGYTNTANRAFPNALYTPETNPGLV